MVPPPLRAFSSPSSSLLVSLLATASQHVPSFSNRARAHFAKRADHDGLSNGEFIAFACLIPILVVLSGLFAGLTLGYMSLDETQLHVLSISGTPLQRKYANQIKPIRQNGHLLLVTLLLANMITNETLPIIADPVLGGGVQSVVVSIVLIVIFAEIIPQSICTRHGLYIGAKMAPLVKVLLYTLGVVAWPVAKILELSLGPHHGIIYRRGELKELIAMHSTVGQLGGDLRSDTVTIIGATLDLQEKTAKQSMTKIDDVFMLSIDAKLDYKTLQKICSTGHSRIPVFEEVEVPDREGRMTKVPKILGVLLVKQCVLLDPKDAVPVRKVQLNKLPSVYQNEPLLGILDKFQEGRSHMAVVSRLSIAHAASVKKAVKKGLTQRLKDRVGISDSSSSDSDSEEEEQPRRKSWRRKKSTDSNDGTGSPGENAEGDENDATLKGDGVWEKDFANGNGGNGSSPERERFSFKKRGRSKRGKVEDVEMGRMEGSSESPAATASGPSETINGQKVKKGSFVQLPKAEASMPADAVLNKENVNDFLQSFDPLVAPLGIITLEDVLEELIGEEIYDEFDPEGGHRGEASKYLPPSAGDNSNLLKRKGSAPNLTSSGPDAPVSPTPINATTNKGSNVLRPIAIPALKNLSFLRSRSAPPTPRELPKSLPSGEPLETVQSRPDDSKVEPKIIEGAIDDMDEKERMKMEDAEMMASPPIVVTPPSSPPRSPPANALAAPTATPGVAPGVTAAIGSGISRSGSPASSLGAIIFDRGRQKRAAQAQTGGASGGPSIVAPIPSPRAVTPSASGGKGQRFKSSPLAPGSTEGQSAARGGPSGTSGMSAVDEDVAGNQADDEGYMVSNTDMNTKDEKEM